MATKREICKRDGFHMSIHKIRQPGLDTEISPSPLNAKYITQLLSNMPSRMKFMIMNYMTPADIYASLLLDNPKNNFNEVLYDYLKYLKENIEHLKKQRHTSDMIPIFGLNPQETWKDIDSRSHLVNIAAEKGIFWEYIIWDAPFVMTMLIAIENSDGKTLRNLIDFYECPYAECAFYLMEFLLKYAYDLGRIPMLIDIFEAFTLLIGVEQNFERLNSTMGAVMDYFIENHDGINVNNLVNDDVDLVNLVTTIEKYFGENLFKFYSINWTGYVYYLVKRENNDELYRVGQNLNEPYTELDYEVIIYAIVNKKYRALNILLKEFRWNDRRDDLDKAFFGDFSKSQLEKIVWYLLQNIENQKHFMLERGFDPSSKCYPMQFYKPSREGVQRIYQAQDKRHHMTIYHRALETRQYIMEEWCSKINGNAQEMCQGLCNDLESRRGFNNGIIQFLIYKLNMAISNLNIHHVNIDNVDELIREYTELTGMMYHGNQYASGSGIKVV
jgi:hypothetical protein